MEKIITYLKKFFRSHPQENVVEKVIQIHEGYWKITQIIVDYFSQYGIHDGMVFDDIRNQSEANFEENVKLMSEKITRRKQILENERIHLIEVISALEKNNLITKQQLNIQDMMLFLDSISKPIDLECLKQFINLILIIFHSLTANQEKQINEFFDKSFFFSLKFKQRINISEMQQKFRLSEKIVGKLNRKIAKNKIHQRRKMIKRNNKRGDYPYQVDDEQQKVKVKESFIQMFIKLKSVIEEFISNEENRKVFLLQEKTKNYMMQQITIKPEEGQIITQKSQEIS